MRSLGDVHVGGLCDPGSQGRAEQRSDNGARLHPHRAFPLMAAPSPRTTTFEAAPPSRPAHSGNGSVQASPAMPSSKRGGGRLPKVLLVRELGAHVRDAASARGDLKDARHDFASNLRRGARPAGKAEPTTRN